MSLFVDTSIWSLALRRDSTASNQEIRVLVQVIESGETLLTTGLVLQELLQGFSGPKSRDQILDRFSSVPLLVPDRHAYKKLRTAKAMRLSRRSAS